jgi:hypothetical protein
VVAILLVAAAPITAQKLSGTLRYGHANICGIPDFIALPVMDNIYLRGPGFPTQGQYAGCQITAVGNFAITSSSVGQCKVFEVSRATIVCPNDNATTAPVR